MFQFFTDQGLTTPQTGNIIIPQKSDGSTGPVQVRLWLGDDDPAFKYQTEVNPGTNNIQINIVDAALGTGNPATDVKLANSQPNLGSAVAGAPLVLNTEIVGGSVNAQNVWLEVQDSTGVVGTSIELSIQTNDLVKLAV